MTHYYDSHDLSRFGEIGKNCPELADKFFEWYGAVFQDGALTAREKALIALGVAHAVQCPYCIDAYSQSALEKGADLDHRGRARFRRYSRRRLPGARRADAQSR